jgi:hypothetical protein
MSNTAIGVSPPFASTTAAGLVFTGTTLDFSQEATLVPRFTSCIQPQNSVQHTSKIHIHRLNTYFPFTMKLMLSVPIHRVYSQIHHQNSLHTSRTTPTHTHHVRLQTQHSSLATTTESSLPRFQLFSQGPFTLAFDAKLTVCLFLAQAVIGRYLGMQLGKRVLDWSILLPVVRIILVFGDVYMGTDLKSCCVEGRELVSLRFLVLLHYVHTERYELLAFELAVQSRGGRIH